MHTSPYIYEIPGNLNVPTLEEDAKRDLLTRPRSIPPKYFYDATGSDLFEKICRTPEYYPTRRENEILRQYGPTIIERVQPTNILEIGSGSSAKTERILDACMQIRQRPCYSAFDISSKALLEAKTRLDKKYSWLDTSLLLGDYEAGFAHVPRVNGANLVLFLGSTIGNLNPRSAVSMLNELYNYMSSQDYLLLGYDRVKDGEILDAAYNDDQGLTAEFNLNILNVLNDRLGADFVLDRFEHSASYDTLQQQVEMQLVAKCAQTVNIQKLSVDLELQKNETIQTEISRKFTVVTMRDLLSQANFKVVQTFSSPDEYFSLALACPA